MLCLAVMLGNGTHASPGQARASERDLEAAYLFNFGKFLYMPADPAPPHGDTFDLCLIGSDPLGDVLERITSGEKIDGHAVRVLKDRLPPDARSCDIVFISSSEHTRMDRDIAALAGADVLSVSDDPGFLQRGGMVQFVLKDNHLRFAVNLDAVAHTRITLSSELLRLAVFVSGTPRQEVTP